MRARYKYVSIRMRARTSAAMTGHKFARLHAGHAAAARDAMRIVILITEPRQRMVESEKRKIGD